MLSFTQSTVTDSLIVDRWRFESIGSFVLVGAMQIISLTYLLTFFTYLLTYVIRNLLYVDVTRI